MLISTAKRYLSQVCTPTCEITCLCNFNLSSSKGGMVDVSHTEICGSFGVFLKYRQKMIHNVALGYALIKTTNLGRRSDDLVSLNFKHETRKIEPKSANIMQFSKYILLKGWGGELLNVIRLIFCHLHSA